MNYSGANSDESSDELSLPARISPSVRRAINHMEKCNKRRTTDKYWSGLFVLIFSSWIVACQYVTLHETEYSILSNNSSEPVNTTKPIIIPENSTAITINISELLHQESDKEIEVENGCTVKKKRKKEGMCDFIRLLILDPITFDLSRLNIEEETQPRTVWLMHLYIGATLLATSFAVIYANRTFCKQPLVIGATFFFVALLEHLSAWFYANNSITFTLLSSHKKITSWMIPEAMLLIVCIMRSFAGVPAKKIGKHDQIPTSPNYKFTIAVGVPMFVTFHLLGIYTISLLQKVSWGSGLFYMIAGGSCYVGLTIYYFGTMVISCAIHVSHDLKRSRLTNLFRALIIIARYHFGTACYLATSIIPRIHATFVMNESKLKTLSRRSSCRKFFMTHCSVHNFITTFTGVHGTSYAKSLKELLRLRSTDVINKQFHYYYDGLSILLLLFLLGVNGIMILLLWMYDLDDPQFSLATRAMYLKIGFMFFLAFPLLQASTDAHAFLAYRSWLRESGSDIYADMMLGKYFEEFDSSDDDTNSIDSGVFNDTLM